MILGAIGEWIIGNTFPFVVFGTFGTYTQCLRRVESIYELNPHKHHHKIVA